MVEEVKDTIFVGGIPYDMTLEEFEEEVQIWGPVTKKYLKYHGGWGTVTFESNSSRNRFLKDKTRHKVGSKLVDVKPYIYNPEKVSFDDLFIGLFVRLIGRLLEGREVGILSLGILPHGVGNILF